MGRRLFSQGGFCLADLSEWFFMSCSMFIVGINYCSRKDTKARRVSGVGLNPLIPNLTARFAQDAKDAKKIFISTLRVTTVIIDINNLSDFCVFAVQDLSSVFRFCIASS